MCCLPFAEAHLHTAGGHSCDAKVLVVPGASLGTRTGAAGLCRAVPQGMSQLAQLRSLGPLCLVLLCPGPRPCQLWHPRRRCYRQQWWSAAPSQQCVPPSGSPCRTPLQVPCSKEGSWHGNSGNCCMLLESTLLLAKIFWITSACNPVLSHITLFCSVHSTIVQRDHFKYMISEQ